ncbi:MAG: hypothetical protein ACHQFZ_05270 [Acidimicrobiales bacterium]
MTPRSTPPPPEVFFAGDPPALDGTVYLGDHLFDRAASPFAALRDVARVVFVTNKPRGAPGAGTGKLTRLGGGTSGTVVVTSRDSPVRCLEERRRGASRLTVAERLVNLLPNEQDPR